MSEPLRVLFLCTANSCRSQMAEGWARALGKGRVQAFSAGGQPSHVHPIAIEVMADSGVDISAAKSKSLDQFLGQPFDFVITVCDRAKESCVVWPEVRQTDHWSIEDPATASGDDEQRLRAFRRARDEIKQRINLFLLANKVL